MHFLLFAVVALALSVNLTQAGYHFSKDQVNFIDANLNCRRQGRQLVVINSAGKQLDLANTIRALKLDQQTFWISATSLNNPTSKKFFWLSNGQPLQYANWDANQPDNYKGVEHCVQIWSNHNQKWNDINCENKYNYICEDICCGCNI